MQEFLIAGSGVALAAAIVFLILVTLKGRRLNAIYTYLFFGLSMLILALYVLLWHIEFGRVGQETQATAGLVSNASLGQWGQILGGGIAAALLTLGGREVVTWLRRPKVELTFENREPFCTKADEPPRSYWLRAKVTNSGKSVAKSCVGRLVQFRDKSGNIIEREPVRLNWVGTPWRELELLAPVDVNQGDSLYLNVLFTIEDSSAKAFLYTNEFLQAVNTSRQGIGTPQQIWAFLPELPSVVQRIQIAIYGNNIKACSKEYSIHWPAEDAKYTDIRLKEVNKKHSSGES